MSKLLTLKEMAAELSIHPETLRRYVRERRVKRFYRLARPNGALRFNPDIVIAELQGKKK